MAVSFQGYFIVKTLFYGKLLRQSFDLTVLPHKMWFLLCFLCIKVPEMEEFEVQLLLQIWNFSSPRRLLSFWTPQNSNLEKENIDYWMKRYLKTKEKKRKCLLSRASTSWGGRFLASTLFFEAMEAPSFIFFLYNKLFTEIFNTSWVPTMHYDHHLPLLLKEE